MASEKTIECAALMSRLLSDGPQYEHHMAAWLRGRGFSQHHQREARKLLGVTSRHLGPPTRAWKWSLPGHEEAAPRKHPPRLVSTNRRTAR